MPDKAHGQRLWESISLRGGASTAPCATTASECLIWSRPQRPSVCCLTLSHFRRPWPRAYFHRRPWHWAGDGQQQRRRAAGDCCWTALAAGVQGRFFVAGQRAGGDVVTQRAERSGKARAGGRAGDAGCWRLPTRSLSTPLRTSIISLRGRLATAILSMRRPCKSERRSPKRPPVADPSASSLGASELRARLQAWPWWPVPGA